MKVTFTATSKARAEKFQKHIKQDRKLESSLAEKDGKFIVTYEIPTVVVAKKVKVKKGAKKSKDMPMDQKDMGDPSKCAKKDTPEKDADKKSMSKADMGGMDMEPDDDECDYVEMDDLQEMLGSLAQFLYNEMQYQLNWVWSEIDYIENAFYQHQQGHLPPINGADKMQKALDVLGIGGDYQIQKPVIYASTKRGVELELDLTAKR